MMQIIILLWQNYDPHKTLFRYVNLVSDILGKPFPGML